MSRRKFKQPPEVLRSEVEQLISDFLLDQPLTAKSYENLFRYFVQGFAANRSSDGAYVHYPGLRSYNGRQCDGLEGYARSVPLFASWLGSGRAPVVELTDGSTFDLASAFRRGLVAGTDPKHPAYWGRVRHYSQRIVEASDIALSIWLLRDSVWRDLSAAEKERAVDWLRQVLVARAYNNGWLLFAPFVGVILKNLGYAVRSSSTRNYYDRVKAFHRGEGWFSDGPKGVFDFYNAWHYHYLLFWFQEIDPDWDPEFISATQRKFLATYRFLLGPEGVPLLGRSICYRMALPAPLIIGCMKHPDVVSIAEARRSLDCIWRYFARHGGLRGGNVTQGYHHDDPRIVDNYSGPASALWSLRSLVVAFYLPEDSAFWQDSSGKLPVEKEDYRVTVNSIGWVIRGDKTKQLIEIENLNARAGSVEFPVGEYGNWRRLLERLLGIPFRPGNNKIKYGRRTYSSARPLPD
jgi:hypothetical protein